MILGKHKSQYKDKGPKKIHGIQTQGETSLEWGNTLQKGYQSDLEIKTHAV